MPSPSSSSRLPVRRSPLAFVVLALLAESPMHAYRMQQLIRQRGKDKVVNVAQRNSVIQAVERLLRDGAIEVQHVERERKRPERTVYRITPAGRAVFEQWMREMLSCPAREYPQLPAALAFLGLFAPDEVVQQLRARAVELTRLLDADPPAGAALPRVFLIEDEYLRAMTEAELRWVERIIGEIERGELQWDPAELLAAGEPGNRR